MAKRVVTRHQLEEQDAKRVEIRGRPDGLSRELLRRGIRMPQTPADSEACKPWVRTGFELYDRLQGLDYQAYPAEEAERQFLESSPLACYSVWLGKTPFRKGTLEGRLQRQLILYDLELEIPDPMLFFEEITRFRILQGSLPEDILYAAGELDALLKKQNIESITDMDSCLQESIAIISNMDALLQEEGLVSFGAMDAFLRRGFMPRIVIFDI